MLDTLLDAGMGSIAETRSFLARYGFRGDDVFKDVGVLSGGERSRVAIAILSLSKAHFLLLDEPTNHLDIRSQEVLQDVLKAFNGTILMVSHDRYLIHKVATHVWAIAENQLHVFNEGYEAYEAWYPRTLWNPAETHVSIVTDWEGYNGRSKYASMGGCYYSGRLAVMEHLMKVRRQARVFILREAYPDYILPVGVWQVRENVRNAMRQPPMVYATLDEALARLQSRLSIPLEQWMDAGFLLRQTISQRKITDYF